MSENWLNCQEKASFLLILTKSVEPSFQSAGPISQHTALKGALNVTTKTSPDSYCSCTFLADTKRFAPIEYKVTILMELKVT